MSSRAEHLRNDVFGYHTLIDVQFVEKHRAIEVVFGIFSAHKRLRHKQTRICHIAFLRRMVGTQRKSDARVGRIKAGVDYHCLVQPHKRIFVGTETRRFSER